jgi:hypothetical protein
VGASSAILFTPEQKTKAVKTRLTADILGFWTDVDALTGKVRASLEKLQGQFADPAPENPTFLHGFTREQKLALFGEDAALIVERKALVEKALVLLDQAMAYEADAPSSSGSKAS